MSTFLLKILTPAKEFYKGEVECVSVQTLEGSRGILKRHESFISYLPIGKIKVRNSGEEKIAAITGGIVQVNKSNNEVKILTNACEWESEIDLDRAIKSKEEALEAIAAIPDKAESKVLEYRLDCANNRIKVVEKRNDTLNE